MRFCWQQGSAGPLTAGGDLLTMNGNGSYYYYYVI